MDTHFTWHVTALRCKPVGWKPLTTHRTVIQACLLARSDAALRHLAANTPSGVRLLEVRSGQVVEVVRHAGGLLAALVIDRRKVHRCLLEDPLLLLCMNWPYSRSRPAWATQRQTQWAGVAVLSAEALLTAAGPAGRRRSPVDRRHSPAGRHRSPAGHHSPAGRRRSLLATVSLLATSGCRFLLATVPLLTSIPLLGTLCTITTATLLAVLISSLRQSQLGLSTSTHPWLDSSSTFGQTTDRRLRSTLAATLLLWRGPRCSQGCCIRQSSGSLPESSRPAGRTASSVTQSALGPRRQEAPRSSPGSQPEETTYH